MRSEALYTASAWLAAEHRNWRTPPCEEYPLVSHRRTLRPRLMAWFKVDDRFYTNRKVLRIPRAIRPAAIGSWILAGTWSASQRMSGTVPDHVLDELGITSEVRAVLVHVGMWEEDEHDHEPAIYFHDWEDYQPIEDLDAIRAKWRADKRRQRAEGHVQDTSETQVDSPLPPDPTRPEPSRESSDEDSARETSKTKLVITKGEWAKWWDTYPRHVAEEKAIAAYRKARSRATREELLAGAERYRDDPNREPAFTAHPTTWLNRGSWKDDPLPARVEGGRPTPVTPPLRSFN